MFVDICYPKNNEDKFIEIANKLSTKELCFVYDKHVYYKKRINLKVESLSREIKKNIIYYYEPDNRFGFHAPVKNINQVVMKNLAATNPILGISFNSIQKNPKSINQIKFVIDLAKKYNIDVFFASFAHSPFKLRSKNELASVLNIIGVNKLLIKSNSSILSTYLKKQT